MEPDLASPRRRRMVRGTLLFLGIVLVAGSVIHVAITPPQQSSILPGCTFHNVTGLHCPGCGGTRAWHAMLNGDLRQAIAWNAVSLVVAPVLLIALIRSLWAWLWQTPIRESSRPPRLWPALLLIAFLLLFGVLRNLPWEPFTGLAPHEVGR